MMSPNFLQALQQTAQAFVILDKQGVICHANPAFNSLFGFDAAETAGRSIDILAPSGRNVIQRFDRISAQISCSQPFHGEVIRITSDGRAIPVMLSCSALCSTAGEIDGYVVSYVDISERKHTEQALQQANEQLSLALEASQLSLWDMDILQDRVSVDSRWGRMLGYPETERKMRSAQLFHSLHPDDYSRIRQASLAALRGDAPRFQEEFRCRNAHDGWTWIRCIGKVVARNEDGLALRAVGTNQDITEHKRKQEQIDNAAHHDWLTGLPNRFSLTRHLAQALARAQRKAEPVAVCMIDLDDFKPVNDNWGHEAGDQLLQDFARRLQALMRKTDFVARLGGDEFVVVMEYIGADQTLAQLQSALQRLHQAVESPFAIDRSKQAEVGMTVGVALYPHDGTEADALMRQADAAMYQAKQHKSTRANWWRMAADEAEYQDEQGSRFEVYGTEADQLLAKCKPLISKAIDRYISLFYAQASMLGSAQDILDKLFPDELQGLQLAHRGFLSKILAPGSSASSIRSQSLHLGRVHGLVGVTSPMLVQSVELLRRQFSEELNQTLLPMRQRYRLLEIIDSRLQEQLHAQLEAATLVKNQYIDIVPLPMPHQGSLWADTVVSELEQLGKLPGMQAVLLMRLMSNGIFVPERSAGPQGQNIANILQTPGCETVVDPNSARGQSLSAVAWRSGRICSSASYGRDHRYAPWHQAAQQIQVRATLSIPIRNNEERTVAVLSFFGAYPGQFESATMQQFAQGLQHRWELILAACTKPAPAIQQNLAIALRERLFAGGLDMFLQPMVDLHSGQVVKVEALARLRQEDGQIISPGIFLPLLGDAELDHLFRLGLDKALQQLGKLDELGMKINISLNIGPSTLQDPDCPQWIAEALQRHQVAPERLSLELLETDGLSPMAQDKAIERLRQIGIQLAMDDLGSGYSSLQRLSALPFDTVKIDQSLTLNLRKTPLLSLALIRAIIQLGQDLERQVVVEGLEDIGMLEAVCILGASLGQGYSLARPMAQTAFADWLQQFALPIRPGHIGSYLGALAQHWLYAQPSHGQMRPSMENCPLYHFLQQHADADADILALHEQSHYAAVGSPASQALTNWLSQQVLLEGKQDGPT